MTAALFVDLDAIAANIARIRATVAPAEFMLVVKDDAYGHGLASVVRRAVTEGVSWFGAFDARTGREVRAVAGPTARIFVWIAASAADLADAIEDRLDIGVGDNDLLEELAVRASRVGGSPVRVHLKIDTGLHRNGIRPEDWPAFVARARAIERGGAIEVVGVWSHIAEASDDEDDAARAIFDAAVDAARAAGLRPRLRHLAASAASFARAEFRYDLVRVGAFCYGIRSVDGPPVKSFGLRVAARLQADVVRADADVVSIGVGALEGLPSSLGGRARVGTPAGGRELLSIGEDSLVESWRGASVGDIVTVFGTGDAGECSATDLAELIGTVGEEILVRLSPEISRVYAGR